MRLWTHSVAGKNLAIHSILNILVQCDSMITINFFLYRGLLLRYTITLIRVSKSLAKTDSKLTKNGQLLPFVMTFSCYQLT